MTNGITIQSEMERVARENGDDPASLDCVWLEKHYGEWLGAHLQSRTTRHTGKLSDMDTTSLPWDMYAYSPQFVYFLREGVGVSSIARNPDGAFLGREQSSFS